LGRPQTKSGASDGLLLDTVFPFRDMTSISWDRSSERPEKSAEHIEMLKEIEMTIDGLKAIEGRLGTPQEMPGDIELARERAHRVNNLLTTFRLTVDFKASGPNP
jgi:hypothetical protein